MTPDPRRDIEHLLEAALALEGAVRAQYLDSACAGDVELRREVESLLARASRAERFLESGSGTVTLEGQQLGPYQIESMLGSGGMGEVYKAHDSRLRRAVAIKVLPAANAGCADLRQRLEREARAVSSLNHPHICTLHDIGHQDGIDYLVMEYIAGETLAQRLKKGPLPLEQSLRCAVETAGALDHAHRKGIVHRDLKPGNIMLTKSGVKVLDFGLAKLTSGLKPSDASADTLTEKGLILGTVQYMAPEQLEAKDADARSDIFAFGAVLHEMVTGKKAFEGESRASLIAAILERETAPIAPVRLDVIVRRCLAKAPDERFQNAADLAWMLSGVAATPVEGARPRGYGRTWMVTAVIFALSALVLAVSYFSRKPPEAAVTRFSLATPDKTDFADVSVSPDGRRVAFTGATADGGQSLWLRPVDSLAAHELPGTENALGPFWSPDNRSIGFWDHSGLKKISIGPGPISVEFICPAEPSRGAAWGPDGTILFSFESTSTGLYRVAASGGTPMPVTELSAARQEVSHRYPEFLPDGRHFLYWVWSASEEFTGIYIGSLDAIEKLSDRGPLVHTWRAGTYSAGYLLFMQGSTLMAQRFDADKLSLMGERQALREHVSTAVGRTGFAIFSSSVNGTLAYQEAAPLPGSRVVWRDRAGKLVREIEAPHQSSWPSLAPDEKRLAVFAENERDVEDVWVIDLERGASTRLTASTASNRSPVWSPDGRRIVFASNRSGVVDLYMKDADGTGAEQLFVKSEHLKYPFDWSRDGRFIVYLEQDPKTNADLWVLPLQGDRKPFPFLNTEFEESGGRFSPVPDAQGRLWMVYMSNETGQAEVYLRPFTPGAPGGVAGAKVRISTGGGFSPKWRKDGRELFYFSGGNYFSRGKLMAVDVKLGVTAEIGAERRLFEINHQPFASVDNGQRFLFLEMGDFAPAKINVVLNWQAELKR